MSRALKRMYNRVDSGGVGGQKQRVAIARAVYNPDAEIYLLDDPLSALDPEVANKIFSAVVTGLLQEKTVVLVTHGLNFCSRADQIVFLHAGKIVQHGTSVLPPSYIRLTDYEVYSYKSY